MNGLLFVFFYSMVPCRNHKTKHIFLSHHLSITTLGKAIIRKDIHRSEIFNNNHLDLQEQKVLITSSHVANDFSYKSPGKFNSTTLSMDGYQCSAGLLSGDWTALRLGMTLNAVTQLDQLGQL